MDPNKDDLYFKLLEFNKLPQPTLKDGTELIIPALRGGFRLGAASIHHDISFRKPDVVQFWEDLVRTLDGPNREDSRKYVYAMRDAFLKYSPTDVLDIIKDLYLKSGHIHDRALVEQKQENKYIPQITSQICYWKENGHSCALSNQMFFLHLGDFGGNIYYIKTPKSLEELINAIKKDNNCL